MKRKLFSLILCLGIVLCASIGVSAASLGTYTGQITCTYSKKIEARVNTELSGTWLNVHTSRYSTVGFHQKAVLGSGETQVSPDGEVDINLNVWCGFWSGYSTVPGKSIMAYMRCPYFLATDTITSCDWWY